MPVTIKCPDCGHTEESNDGASKTCPQCEGAMSAPPKKKYQAKSSSLEDEERAKKKDKLRNDDEKPKKKAKPRDDDEDEDEKPKTKKKPRDDEDEEEEKPKPKKKAAEPQEAMSLDDDDDDGGEGDNPRNAKVAERLGIDPGFTNKALMRQVAKELSRGEVLYFAVRPSEAIAKKQGLVAMIVGTIFALLGIGAVVLILTVLSEKVPWYVAFIPLFMAFIGGAIAVLGPIMKNRQARLGWYAVTDRRAIVFNIALWGKSGQVETYQPAELRKMWIKKSFWLKGGGDLVFKTIITQRTRTERDRTTGRTRTSTSTSKEHFGFLGIEDAKEVEALIHEVLLSGRRDEDDEEDDDD
jgi:hypothetical protein